MDDYTLKPDIEPTDKYEKAKISLLEAIKDFSDLTPQQQYKLMNEFVEVEQINMFLALLDILKDKFI